jgi:broad specificity phosphatase PhoE
MGTMMRRVLASCLIVLLTSAAAAAQPAVFIVRHAERADAGTPAAKMTGANPDLSPEGVARAASLATLLKDTKITAIVTSEYTRTRQTAAPLAKAAGIEMAQIPSKDTAALIQRVSAASGNVLVVGHSNSIPELIKGLGISEPVEIAETDYDNLFIVVRGAKPSLIRLHYR